MQALGNGVLFHYEILNEPQEHFKGLEQESITRAEEELRQNAGITLLQPSSDETLLQTVAEHTPLLQ